jgi:redox-sensitive bicupin YhaK (pirin superfamily)
MQLRKVNDIVSARPTSDGAGVKISRLAGFGSRFNMDPFLMLDEIRSDNEEEYKAGFPPHPHRGFETVTYMLAGGFSHQDSMGNKGNIGTGGAQWMTAASGVIHSEMPNPGSDSKMHGFQFWLNLPASEKMGQPAYRDIAREEIPSFGQGDAQVHLVAGDMEHDGRAVHGAVTGKTTRALMADVTLPANGGATLAYAAELSSQFYVYKGEVRVGDRLVKRGQLATLSEGDMLELTATGPSGLLLFGGLPLNEPVTHYGPFVMNTQAEIDEAVTDYREGRLVKNPARIL